MTKMMISVLVVMFAIPALGQFSYSHRVSPKGVLKAPDDGKLSSVQKYPPSIMFSTLLNNVTVNARGGWFKLGNQMQNVFIPKGSKGRTVLSKVDGKEFCIWNWQLDAFRLRPPYQLFSFRQALNPDGSPFDYSNMKLTQPGKYRMDFYLGENLFYTFRFGLSTLEPDDPFDGETMYFTDGPWNDWGYLYYANANPGQSLSWKLWLRERSFGRPGHKIKIQVIRAKDGKVICVNRPNVTYSFRHDWVRHKFDLIHPPKKTSGGAYFKARDLLAVDGGYRLQMSMDGKRYGVWKFRVANGKLEQKGQTVRGKADPLTFVEGGKDAFWYKKEAQ